MNHIELLAPAKDLECGIAAIDSGADALYIGASQFGAREAAGNNIDDIAGLVRYAHKYWAKVYATVNTLLKDDEIPKAVELIHRLYDVGIDGIIIQDTGLLECDLPPIPLIASTQMHNDTPEKVAFLEKVGIKRVILSRELDLDQIREIRQQTNVELEFFVHGALCVCYSGQCYLSYALGGRSGNRGQCAQPCRKLYTLLDADSKVIMKDKHLLSLKDFNLSDYLRELIDVGISSFKIEGRLKDKAYVTNVVSFYREKLDEVIREMNLQKSSSGTSHIDFTPDVGKTFNRGYTTYFINGRAEEIGSIETPKMVGELLGKVTSVTSHGFTLDTSIQVHNGDGICFFNRNGELKGSRVNDVNGSIIIPDKKNGIQKGTMVYRNHDHEFLNTINKARIERLIDVRLTLSENDEGFVLSAIDEDGNEAWYVLNCGKTLAEKPEKAIENINRQLLKSGGTEFECSDIKIELDQPYFLPISMLNELRRGVLEELRAARECNYPRETGRVIINDVSYPTKNLTYLGNVLNKKAEAFYMRHGVESIEPAAESGIDMRGRKVMTTRYCLKEQLGLCGKQEKPSPIIPLPILGEGKTEPSFTPSTSIGRRGRGMRAACSIDASHFNLKSLSLVDAEGNILQLRFNCAKCLMEIYLADK